MPKKFSADVVTTNLRLPKALHKRLEQDAKRAGTSITFEAANRLIKSFEKDRWPSAEDLGRTLLFVALRFREVRDDPHVKQVIDELEEAALQKEIMNELFPKSERK